MLRERKQERRDSFPSFFSMRIGSASSKFSSFLHHIQFVGQVSAAQNRLRLNMRSQSHSNDLALSSASALIC